MFTKREILFVAGIGLAGAGTFMIPGNAQAWGDGSGRICHQGHVIVLPTEKAWEKFLEEHPDAKPYTDGDTCRPVVTTTTTQPATTTTSTPGTTTTVAPTTTLPVPTTTLPGSTTTWPNPSTTQSSSVPVDSSSSTSTVPASSAGTTEPPSSTNSGTPSTPNTPEQTVSNDPPSFDSSQTTGIPSPNTLPETGSNPRTVARWALVLLAVGGAAMRLGKRERSA